MSAPYRDQHAACPACQSPLRALGTRLCCDGCSGIFLERADLARSIGELTQDEPTLEFVDDRAGERACPRCAAMMVACALLVQVAGKRARLTSPLDRCDRHGVWFDTLELARSFEAIHALVTREGFGRGKRLRFDRGRF
ncbi:MAG: hypothetical protein K8W52_32995 [Deltaproteobacteria bacterium]|nr:hypothetical protein [Deltaproteobacteria bacterium]